MNFKEKLYNKIMETGAREFSVRKLFKRLGAYSSFERAEILRALDELSADGKIVEVAEGVYSVVKEGTLIKGTLRGNRRGFAFLVREDGGADWFIPNRALHGALHGDTVLARLNAASDSKDEGEVVKILERGYYKIVGTLDKNREGCGFVISDDDSYFTDIFIPAYKCKEYKTGLKVVASITAFGKKGPEGEITEVLGREGTVKGDTLSIIRAHGFKECFSSEVLEEADRVSSEDIKYEIKNREDFRKDTVITIDGDDARDFDDAVSIEKIQNGYRLYVHIADVGHYVKRGSRLDKEALERATSVYLPNMVLPMLPEKISNGCCSLVENEDRLTTSCIMDIDFGGKVTGSRVVKGVIRSRHRMTYRKTAAILAGDKELCTEYADIVDMLYLMDELAKILQKNRHARGSIDFVTHESLITLQGDKVVNIERYPYEVTNGIIEEFMLIANQTVAEYLGNAGFPCVYRVHEKPTAEKLKVFSMFVSGCGYKFPIRNEMHSMQFQQFLEQVKGSAVENIVSKIMLRSMQKAKYSTVNVGHFGLALKDYCHFTSPIRRYPDLTVHRVLDIMLSGGFNENSLLKTQSVCQSAADISSKRERDADMAERDADDYFKALFMEDKVGEVYEGFISGVTQFGIFVELDNTVEGMITVDNLPRDNYSFDDKLYTLKGYRHSYTLGNKVKIRVAGADVVAKQVDFYIYEK